MEWMLKMQKIREAQEAKVKGGASIDPVLPDPFDLGELRLRHAVLNFFSSGFSSAAVTEFVIWM